jgi:hypothetical protein
MASEQDLATLRAAAVQAALEGDTEKADKLMAIGKTVEDARNQSTGKKGGKSK